MNLSPDTSTALFQAAQAETINAVNASKVTDNEKELARYDAAAKDFEAVFITEMIKPMFEGIKTDERFGGGKGEEVFNGLMLQEYGKLIAETGQIGIASSIKEELIRIQSEADGGNKTDTNTINLPTTKAANASTTTGKSLDIILEEQINAK